MTDFIENSKTITEKVYRIVSKISKKATNDMINEIADSQSIFIFGAGRSGLVSQAFAMRLVHIGKTVHFVGEITMPAIKKSDSIIIVSGSGETISACNIAKASKTQKAKIIAITGKTNSKLADLSDILIKIAVDQGKRKTNNYLTRQIVPQCQKIAPLGTLFELAVMIYFDSVIPVLMKKNNVSENQMKVRHSNLE